MDEETRRAVAAADEALPPRNALPGAIDTGRVVFGFDGYLDRVREVVADRNDPESHERLATLEGFGDRIDRSVAADSSLSFEWLQQGSRTGGHTSHLARAFGGWSFDPVMVGMYGEPVHDAFEAEFGGYELHSLGDPGVTDAVEFDDGKLMLTEIGDTMSLDWAELDAAFGHDRLAGKLDGASLLGTGYWSETPDLPTIFDGLRDLWGDIDDPPGTVLVDPGDVRQLGDDVLAAGIEPLRRFAAVAPVTLSANRAETSRLAAALDASSDSLAAAATAVRDGLDLRRAVAHAADASVVAGPEGTAAVTVPRVEDPAMTTSAGDHFNVGLALGLSAGLSDPAAVCLGNAVAGVFVRTGEPPTETALREFLDGYLDAVDA